MRCYALLACLRACGDVIVEKLEQVMRKKIPSDRMRIPRQ